MLLLPLLNVGLRINTKNKILFLLLFLYYTLTVDLLFFYPHIHIILLDDIYNNFTKICAKLADNDGINVKMNLNE